ncbi:hypothetical protein M8R20_27625 [Pseudomonas sp. R2.Fl]|nr:hypothetical protein [Pseudomonas sp. R2.Fl]
MFRRAWVSGSVASIVSTLMVMGWSRRIDGATPAGTNAASQWVWDRSARRARGWSWRHTAIGYVVHHASSVFWALMYEGWRHRRPGRPLAKASAIATLAYIVDYHVVPPRLSPGFEHRIARPGMLMTYAAFALGLYLAGGRRNARR